MARGMMTTGQRKVKTEVGQSLYSPRRALEDPIKPSRTPLTPGFFQHSPQPQQQQQQQQHNHSGSTVTLSLDHTPQAPAPRVTGDSPKSIDLTTPPQPSLESSDTPQLISLAAPPAFAFIKTSEIAAMQAALNSTISRFHQERNEVPSGASPIPSYSLESEEQTLLNNYIYLWRRNHHLVDPAWTLLFASSSSSSSSSSHSLTPSPSAGLQFTNLDLASIFYKSQYTRQLAHAASAPGSQTLTLPRADLFHTPTTYTLTTLRPRLQIPHTNRFHEFRRTIRKAVAASNLRSLLPSGIVLKSVGAHLEALKIAREMMSVQGVWRHIGDEVEREGLAVWAVLNEARITGRQAKNQNFESDEEDCKDETYWKRSAEASMGRLREVVGEVAEEAMLVRLRKRKGGVLEKPQTVTSSGAFSSFQTFPTVRPAPAPAPVQAKDSLEQHRERLTLRKLELQIDELQVLLLEQAGVFRKKYGVPYRGPHTGL